MKKAIIPACAMLALSLIVIIGSCTFLSPCAHMDGSFGACHWAGRALMGLGCVMGLLAALALAVKKARFGAYLSAVPLCALGILTPGRVIDLCSMSTMRCRMVMQPAMMILFAAAGIAALLGALMSAKE